MGAEVKRMAELLKSGATMLQETCPECATPLFRKGKETFCPKCNRTILIIESKEQETRLMADEILASSEEMVLAKIREINVSMKNENDPDRLQAMGNALNNWLEAISRIRRLKAESEQQ